MLIIEYPFASLLLTFIFLFLFPASAPSASPILLLFLSTVSFSFGVLDSASRFSFLFGHCRLWLWPMRLLVSTFLFIWVFLLDSFVLYTSFRFPLLYESSPPPHILFFLNFWRNPFSFFWFLPLFSMSSTITCLPRVLSFRSVIYVSLQMVQKPFLTFRDLYSPFLY